ncbi:MAG: aldo/keto reductase [Spirochaetales bacterium]|nr:aldo/keto reductase [Spirochaetales bacterium]
MTEEYDLDKNVGKLGFGMMRLPRKGDGIDIEETKKLVDAFMISRFNYFDTAFAYPGSEEAIKEALVNRYPRKSYYLASKCAIWSGCKEKEDAEKELDISLERTGAGYFDFYLLHALNKDSAKTFEEWGLWEYFLKKKEEGLIRHLGFSFHDSPEVLDDILSKHPEAEFVQLQINWADWEDPKVQSKGSWEVARKHNKDIIVMEPVKGGLLADPHPLVKEVFSSSDPNASPASWAIRFASSLDGVMTVLSGMNTLEMLGDNVKTMWNFKGFDAKQMETIEKAREVFSSLPSIPCTKCDYCAKVCPMDIGISGTFAAMNTLLLYGNESIAKDRYKALVINKGRKNPEKCIKCGKCEEACPQHIEIRSNLEKAKEHFQ